MTDIDPFMLFRTTLFAFISIYTILTIVSGTWRLARFFGGNDQHKQLLRLYVSYHLLTIRLRDVRNELVEIVLLLLTLAGLWWLHALLGGPP